jgi:CheY-like chemotaxis protein
MTVKKNIVVVDDNRDVVEILRLILGTLGVPVRQAYDGFEALNLINKELPSLMILDLTMPYLDGETVMRQLRRNPRTADLPVIIFTAQQVTREKAEALKIPYSMMLRKGSLSMTDLRKKVLEVLGDEVPIDRALLG